MRKIYTRTGDEGTTGIFGGERVPKDDVRIEANGTIDELNSVIGVVRSLLDEDHEWQELLRRIQTEIMAVMSLVATPSARRDENRNEFHEDLTDELERTMDTMTSAMEDNGYFILPGGTRVSAQLHMARVVSRRAERRLWTLHRTDSVLQGILKFFNRLSDLFFIMARYDMYCQGWSEEKWKEFSYKRKPVQK